MTYKKAFFFNFTGTFMRQNNNKQCTEEKMYQTHGETHFANCNLSSIVIIFVK